MKTLLAALPLIAVGAIGEAADDPVSLNSLLQEMIDPEASARWPHPGR